MIQIISNDAEDILMRFHQHLSARGNLNDAMVGNYIAVARDFASWYESWAGKGFHLRAVTAASLTAYREALSARGMQPLAVQRHIVVLRKLFEWAASVKPRIPQRV